MTKFHMCMCLTGVTISVKRLYSYVRNKQISTKVLVDTNATSIKCVGNFAGVSPSGSMSVAAKLAMVNLVGKSILFQNDSIVTINP